MQTMRLINTRAINHTHSNGHFEVKRSEFTGNVR